MVATRTIQVHLSQHSDLFLMIQWRLCVLMEHSLVIQSCLLKKHCSTLNIVIYELIKNPLIDEDNQEWSVSIEILLLSHYIYLLCFLMQSKCETSLLTSNLTFTVLLESINLNLIIHPNPNPEVLEDLNFSQVLELCPQD